MLELARGDSTASEESARGVGGKRLDGEEEKRESEIDGGGGRDEDGGNGRE